MRNARGFTLLEVMVAMAILAGSLSLLLESQTQSVRSSNRSKMITTAVLLARARMADLEHDLYQDGFSDLGVDSSGDFSDEGFANFRWEWKVETVELPTVSEAQEAASGVPAPGAGSSELPGAAALGAASTAATSGAGGLDPGSAMMASQFEMIRGVVESAVRRGTFTIYWKERAAEQSFRVQAYFTDPTKVDAAMGLGATGGQAGSGLGATGGSAGSGLGATGGHAGLGLGQ